MDSSEEPQETVSGGTSTLANSRSIGTTKHTVISRASPDLGLDKGKVASSVSWEVQAFPTHMAPATTTFLV